MNLLRIVHPQTVVDTSPPPPLPYMTCTAVITDEQLGPCLQAHFHAHQARKTPNRAALLSPHAAATATTVTYAQLDTASDELASMLLQRGVTKNHGVGILSWNDAK
jgi:acyl-CoA synthetase (AMP-forming)/AMP-acid ligase II